MYRDFEYYREIAGSVLSGMKTKTLKKSSGYDKGSYTSSIVYPDGENRDDFFASKFGCRPENSWIQSTEYTKEESYKALVAGVARAIYDCDKRSRPQKISDIYNYYLENKASREDDLYFDGRIGRENIDFFKIIDGSTNDENWKDYYLVSQSRKIAESKYSTFKEMYYSLKEAAKTEWLKHNDRYKLKNGTKLDTFVFDVEDMYDVDNFENQTQSVSVDATPNNDIEFDLSALKNEGEVKVGYNHSNFINEQTILIGRERNVVFPDGEMHKSYFAIVNLSSIKASHNEITFGNTEGYPTDSEGRNVNDRNYKGDTNAQSKVVTVAQNLNPEIIISTSATSSGTPIVSVDGIVVSGNNRVMSMKLASKSYAENYENYVKELGREIQYGGYGFTKTIGTQISTKEPISIEGSSFHNPKNIQFDHPILVRVDVDFDSYTMTELNKYNKSRSKSERQIDMSVRVSKQINDNEPCKKALISLISEQNVVSELYNDLSSVNRFRKILLDCGLITENDLSQLFTSTSLTDVGKTFYNTLLLSLILDPKPLEVSQNAGVKSYTKSLVNAIIPLVKNKSFKEGSLIEDVNKSMLVQNDVISYGYNTLDQYITEKSLFGDEDEYKNIKSLIINSVVRGKMSEFKKVLLQYNNSIESQQGATMFEDNMTPEEVFDATFKRYADTRVVELIENSDRNDLSLPEDSVEDEAVVSDEVSGIQDRISMLERAKKYQESSEDIDIVIDNLKKTIKYL
jgi:hypothetical protein